MLLAEGLPCETYLETGDHADFANGGLAVRLYPSFTPMMREGASCVPLRIVGPEVTHTRALLAGRQWLPNAGIQAVAQAG